MEAPDTEGDGNTPGVVPDRVEDFLALAFFVYAAAVVCLAHEFRTNVTRRNQYVRQLTAVCLLGLLFCCYLRFRWNCIRVSAPYCVE